MRDPHYVRWRETRINSDARPGSFFRPWMSTVLSHFINRVARRCGLDTSPDTVTKEATVAMKPARLRSREVQPISLAANSGMTRITSGVQSPERELSTAVNPSRYDDTAAGEKATWKKIRKC